MSPVPVPFPVWAHTALDEPLADLMVVARAHDATVRVRSRDGAPQVVAVEHREGVAVVVALEGWG